MYRPLVLVDGMNHLCPEIPGRAVALVDALIQPLNPDIDGARAKPIEDMLQAKFGIGGVCIFSPSDPSVAELHVAIEASRPIAAADLAAALHRMMPRAWAVGVRSHVTAAMPRNHMGKIQRNLVKEQLGIS